MCVCAESSGGGVEGETGLGHGGGGGAWAPHTLFSVADMGGGCGDRDPVTVSADVSSNATPTWLVRGEPSHPSPLPPLRASSAPTSSRASSGDSADPSLRRFELDPATISFKEKVGEGSFGTVQRAVWRGMQVAVKSLKFSVRCPHCLLCNRPRDGFCLVY